MLKNCTCKNITFYQEGNIILLDLNSQKNWILIYWILEIVINNGVCIVPNAPNNFTLALKSANRNLTDNYFFSLSKKNAIDSTLTLFNSGEDTSIIVSAECDIWPIIVFFCIAYRVDFNSTLQNFSQLSWLHLEMRLFHLTTLLWPATPNNQQN